MVADPTPHTIPECYNDLRQGKKTFPLIAALTSGTPAATELLPDTAIRTAPRRRPARAATLIDQASGRNAPPSRKVRRNFTAAVTTLTVSPLPEQALKNLMAVSSLIGIRGTNQTITVAFPGHR
jgi:hypothetical protein